MLSPGHAQYVVESVVKRRNSVRFTSSAIAFCARCGKIRAATAHALKPVEFTRRNDLGRAGFYLKSVQPLKQTDATDAD